MRVVTCDDAESARAIWAALETHSATEGRRRLEQNGWAVTAVGSLQEVARRVADVILIDLVLPIRPSGARVVAAPWIARELRRRFDAAPPRNPDGSARPLPALLLWTSNPFERSSVCDARAFLELGGDAIVDKNMSYDAQLQVIVEAAEGRLTCGHSARFGDDGLTPRQRDVLAALEEGLGTGEIAAQLFLSEETVGMHRSALRLELLGAGEHKVRGSGPLTAAVHARGGSWVPWYYRRDPGDDPFALAR